MKRFGSVEPEYEKREELELTLATPLSFDADRYMFEKISERSDGEFVTASLPSSAIAG